MRGQAPRATTPLMLLAVLAGCAEPESRRAPVELRPVPLPDLSTSSERIREQLRIRHADLTRIGTSGRDAKIRAIAFGELGKLFLAARFLEAAEPALTNAHLLAPSEARWPYYLGHLHRTRGNLEDAATFFQRSLVLKPDHATARVWLGRTQLERGLPKSAAEEFARVQDVTGARFAALLGLGQMALAQGDYGQAAQYLEAALAADPQGSAAHYPLATAYRGLDQASKADGHLRLRGHGGLEPPDPWMEEIAAALDSPMIHQRLGVRALERGALAEALAEFRQGLQLDPDPLLRASLMHKLATVLFLMNDVDGAVAQLEEAIRLSPTYPLSHYTLGVILASRGDLQKAQEYFAEVVRLDPGYVEARVALGNVLRQTGEPQAALPHFEQAVRLAPRSADARYGYAIALSRLRRDREAREQLQRALEAHPDDRRVADALKQLQTRAGPG